MYHVMLRGVNKQMIFLSDADNLRFLQILQQVKDVSNFALLGYCLMGNHIHLLIQEREEGEPLDKIMQRIQNRFIGWYNLSYDRCGPLFGGRFRSEAVEDERYLVTVLRYIHQNPVKAGICRRMSDYKWSSYGDYADGKALLEGLVDTEVAEGMFGKNELLRFFDECSDDVCLDDLTPEEMEKTYFSIYNEISGGCFDEAFEKLSWEQKREIVENCKKKGVPLKKLSEYTGMSCYKLRKL